MFKWLILYFYFGRVLFIVWEYALPPFGLDLSINTNTRMSEGIIWLWPIFAPASVARFFLRISTVMCHYTPFLNTSAHNVTAKFCFVVTRLATDTIDVTTV